MEGTKLWLSQHPKWDLVFTVFLWVAFSIGVAKLLDAYHWMYYSNVLYWEAACFLGFAYLNRDKKRAEMETLRNKLSSEHFFKETSEGYRTADKLGVTGFAIIIINWLSVIF